MAIRCLRSALLLAAVVAVPLTAAAVAVAVLRASHLKVCVDRHRIEITARPRRSCPDCRGAGGRWTDGPFPEMEACDCWADRHELHVRLLPVPPWDEPPF
ncbi:hypothetical protein ABT354_34115 [Streptomyces sp. NPDC000594]|uniref:hypothetical protein n=1 Tax=unclassified Streptomyces TaxID=2593676 RepID=UPI003323C447